MFHGGVTFEDDMTSSLAVYGVTPMSNKMLDEAIAGNIARRLHATASSSTRSKRTRAGLADPW